VVSAVWVVWAGPVASVVSAVWVVWAGPVVSVASLVTGRQPYLLRAASDKTD
jgi:hypothetical protein